MIADKQSSSVNIIFSNNLSNLMALHKKTRKEVCNDLDIKYTTFCGWVSGNTIPKGNQLEILSSYFNVEVSYFFIETEHAQTTDQIAKRLFTYASGGKELPPKILENLSDDEIHELYASGFSFQHRKLEEYMSETGGRLILSERTDWGEPVGREIW